MITQIIQKQFFYVTDVCVCHWKVGQGLVFCLPFRQKVVLNWEEVHFRPPKKARPILFVFFVPSLFPSFASNWPNLGVFCRAKKAKR